MCRELFVSGKTYQNDQTMVVAVVVVVTNELETKALASIITALKRGRWQKGCSAVVKQAFY